MVEGQGSGWRQVGVVLCDLHALSEHDADADCYDNDG